MASTLRSYANSTMRERGVYIAILGVGTVILSVDIVILGVDIAIIGIDRAKRKGEGLQEEGGVGIANLRRGEKKGGATGGGRRGRLAV